MPYCDDHRYITELVIEKLCRELGFTDLCQLLGGDNQKILVQHVCDPDDIGDRVIELEEHCICDDKEVDVKTCSYYIRRRAELEKALERADYYDERILQELDKIPICEKMSNKEEYFARHHGGVNINLWWYYIYTAAKECLRDRFGECIVRLARAIHYAQDGPLARYLVIEGALDKYEIRRDEMHDIDEIALSRIIRRDLGTFDVMEPIRRGANIAIKERPFRYNRSIMKTEETLIDTLKRMIELTSYTLVKFNELTRYERRNRERIIRLDILRKLLMGFGFVDLVYTVFAPALTHHLVVSTWMAWLIVIGLAFIVASQLMYEYIEPALFLLKDDGGYRRYIRRILRSRNRRGVRLVTREYKPAI